MFTFFNCSLHRGSRFKDSKKQFENKATGRRSYRLKMMRKETSYFIKPIKPVKMIAKAKRKLLGVMKIEKKTIRTTIFLMAREIVSTIVLFSLNQVQVKVESYQT